jgi:DNA (cytosine-5)-methyltransferase 1
VHPVASSQISAVPTVRASEPAVHLYSGADGVLADDPAQVRNWIASCSRPIAIDLFCGAGGLSLGLQDAGFQVLVGADNDTKAVETHASNLGGLGYAGDLSDPSAFLAQLRRWGISRVDLVAGGVPCQPFSRAGRAKIRSLVERDGRSDHDSRVELWQAFVSVVLSLKPRAVLLENVPDLAEWNGGAMLAAICARLEGAGYRTDVRILDSHRFGVPQHRSRLFVVGVRRGLRFEWPDPTGGINTVRDAIEDLPHVSGGQRDTVLAYDGPRSDLQRRLRRGVGHHDTFVVRDHITRAVRPDDAEAFSLLPEGGTYASLPQRLQRYRADIFADKYKRLEWDGLSRSITAHLAKDGYWYIHPSENRTLSIREAARIQTFPDWFEFCGSPSARYRQIGNAVPPLLGEAIGLELAASLSVPSRRGRPKGPSKSFRASLLTWHAAHRRTSSWQRPDGDPWSVLAREFLNRGRTGASIGQPPITEPVPQPVELAARGDGATPATGRVGRTRREALLQVAREIVHRHEGSVPATEEDLLRLPGVGSSIARAVLVFAYGGRGIIFDTGAKRIAKRLRIAGPVRDWQLRLDLQHRAGAEGSDAEYNSALRDLGALVCIPTEPDCRHCPVRRYCASDGSSTTSLSGQDLGSAAATA